MAWAILRPTRRSFGAALASGYPTEPAELGLPGHEMVFELPGGARTPGFVVEGKESAGPAVVILHGHASGKYSALARAGLLAPYASRVVCFDWRGNGDCAGPGGVMCDFGARAGEDIGAVLAQAQVEGAVVFLGCSMGTACALRAASFGPLAGRVAGVVLDGGFRVWSVGIRAQLRDRRKPRFFLPIVKAVVEFFIPHLRQEDAVLRVAQLVCPVLVLHGSLDHLCPLTDACDIAAAAKDGNIVVFEGAGHLGLHRFDRAKYDAALRDFFHSLSIKQP